MSRILILATLLFAGCKAETSAEAVAAVAPVLDTTAVVAANWRPNEEMTGSLEPIASVQLGFSVGGRLDALMVSRGDSVKVGQPLARLDSGLAGAQLSQAEAAVAGAEAQLAAGESAFTRAKSLYEAKGLSDQAFQDAEAGVKAGRAGLDQAKAAARLARENLSFYTLRSPIDGVVANGPDNAGMVVGPGSALFVIEDLSSLQLKGTASEAATWLVPGLSATVTAGNGATAQATVTRVLPSLDQATRRIPVELRIDAPSADVRAHSFARARVEGGTDAPAWSVPRGALVARPDFLVFRLKDGQPEKVSVNRLGEQGEAALVSGPLNEGDLVVINPPAGLGEQ